MTRKDEERRLIVTPQEAKEASAPVTEESLARKQAKMDAAIAESQKIVFDAARYRYLKAEAVLVGMDPDVMDQSIDAALVALDKKIRKNGLKLVKGGQHEAP